MESSEGKTKSSGWDEFARQITTPIMLVALLTVALTWLASSIAASDLNGNIKGSLLAGVLFVFAGIVGASFYMMLNHPTHFTFDKDAHIQVAIDNVQVENAPSMLKFVSDLRKHGNEEGFIELLAQCMSLADDGNASVHDVLKQQIHGSTGQGDIASAAG